VSEEEFRKEMDVLKGRAASVGKAAAITVGAVGMGLLALGAVAAASSGPPARSGSGPAGYVRPCQKCGELISFMGSVCPHCGFGR